jgi:transaldolase
MKATQTLHDQGQSLWLDNITRDLLQSGTLERYIAELAVTGLTSNPTIFDHAIKNSSAYDAAIRKKVKEGKSGEELFFDLALEDLTRAADLFRPIWDRTLGVDGWVTARRCWPGLPGPASTQTPSPTSSRTKAPSPSSRPGANSWT